MASLTLTRACLQAGWYPYTTRRGTFITPPPQPGHEPDLQREADAGHIAFSGSEQAALAWVRANPREDSPIANEARRAEIQRAHLPLRISAYQWGHDFSDLPFGRYTVHVTFLIGGDRNNQGGTCISRYMHANTYRSIPISAPATLADFEAIGPVLEAPPGEDLWARKIAHRNAAVIPAALPPNNR